MDRPDIQFAVKTLSSYMSRPSIKAMAALQHLASYLDGTPDNGVLLRLTDEGKTVFDFWNDDVLVSDEASIPDVRADSQFVLEAFSDSSWADCKSTRQSTSSGVIFLNGSLVMSVCRTQASVALSSCEAELYAANGLMAESIYLYRLYKFLCGVKPTVKRPKYIHIKQFFLQNLLRNGAFTVHKVNARINPGDLNTKRLGGERRSFFGRLIGLYQPNDDEKNDDSAVRQIKKINRATKEQCVRLMQMAGLTMNMCMQLKGCVRVDHSEYNSSNSNCSSDISDLQMIWRTVVEFMLDLARMVIYYVFATAAWVLFFMVQIAGVTTISLAVMFMLWGPMIWRHFQFLRGFSTRSAPWLMGLMHKWFIKPSLQISWWLLKCEIAFLHARFREERQEGDMMVDIETIFEALDEYLTGGQTHIGAAAALLEPEGEEPNAEPQVEPVAPDEAEPFAPDDDIGEIAYQHARRLNGVRTERRELAMTHGDGDGNEDEDMLGFPNS
eukprot:s2915_g13.t1